MTFDPDIRARPQLLARIKGILLEPKLEWPTIAAEPASIATLYTSYIIPIAGFAVGCQLVRDLLGYSAFGFTYRPGLLQAMGSALWMFGLQLAGVFVLSLVMDWLAPRFGGQKDPLGALKLAGYSATAGWLANVFLLIPWLGFLTILSLYSLYLISTGAPVLLKVPQERALPFTASLVGIGIVASLIFFSLIAPLLPSTIDAPTPPAAETTEGAPASSLSIPGMGKVDLSKLNDLGKRLDALSSGDGKLPVIATVDLAQLMPINLPGFARTETSTSQSSAGLDLASASAVYANGDSVITLSVSDMGVAGALAALPGAIGYNRSEQTGSTYSKLATVDGRMTMEDFDPAAKIGSYSTLIADRVMVKAEGNGVGIEQLKAAVSAVDLAGIEALAKN